ncbi:MAG TPA: DinB family protein [Acidimicrobiales bacterium]|nr:DinB family protein [Acidimicrobiales bacterium]
MDRTDPDTKGDELTLLSQFLDYHRATLVWKVSGLGRQQLGTRLEPSALTLAGLVKHMALVEDSWFGQVLLGRDEGEPWASVDWDDDPDWEFRTAVDDDPDALLALYTDACERSRAAVAEVGDLDRLAAKRSRSGEQFNLRWIMLHMIEETARHNGHADLLRESIDGATGE